MTQYFANIFEAHGHIFVTSCKQTHTASLLLMNYNTVLTTGGSLACKGGIGMCGG